MGFLKTYLATILFFVCLHAKEPSSPKECIPYLLQTKEFAASLKLYEEHKQKRGKHDFELLEQLSLILLEQGIRSTDKEEQLLSLYGSSLASLTSTLPILEEGIKSQNPETQLVSLQLLSQIQDDRCDELLTKGMSSPFLMIRMEAGYHLALRKHLKATGHLESLMYRVPPELWVYFPSFFALIGSKEAIALLKQLMEEPLSQVRTQAILSAAFYGRDDLLPKIRAHATHHSPDEQEASAFALGLLRDSSSITQLHRLLLSPHLSVQLAAARSLYSLGEISALETIRKAAKARHLFALSLLGEMGGSQDLLFPLLTEKDPHVRLNALLSLLKLRDPRVLPFLEELLIRDSRGLGFMPIFSKGGALNAWKVVSSLEQKSQKTAFDLEGVSLHLREQIVLGALELPEEGFLHLARKLFDSKQTPLIPLLVSLLENHQSEGALQLLKEKAMTAGAPLLRAYCSLALYRLHEKGPYEETLYKWIAHVKKSQMIHFRPSSSFDLKRREPSPYELTPEESSRLLIESYQALSDRHDEKGIDILLEGLKEGAPQNRPVLAGLLLRAIQ